MAEESPISDPSQSVAAAAVVRRSPQNLAEIAAAHLERSGHTDEGFNRSSAAIDAQAVCLSQWARNLGLVLTEDHFIGLRKHGMVSAEHEVFHRPADNRAVKRTHSGTFGVTPDRKGDQTAATPLFYLRRLILFNLVFHADVLMEGLMIGGKTLLIGMKGEPVSLVISQPWITAADPSHPHPTPSQIGEYMQGFRFETLSASYFGWHRREDNITILDARPDNFILSVQGVIPIDLVISHWTGSNPPPHIDVPPGPKLIFAR